MSTSVKMYSSNPINSWAVEDRPREKMSLKGRNALSDAELIAILLGTGTKDENALDIAKNILHSAENNLNALGELTLKDLQKIRGIGEAKAIVIAAAMELGRSRDAAVTRLKRAPPAGLLGSGRTCAETVVRKSIASSIILGKGRR